MAAGDHRPRHTPERVDQGRVGRRERALLAADGFHGHAPPEVAERLVEHGVHLGRGHAGERADVHVDLDAIGDRVHHHRLAPGSARRLSGGVGHLREAEALHAPGRVQHALGIISAAASSRSGWTAST